MSDNNETTFEQEAKQYQQRRQVASFTEQITHGPRPPLTGSQKQIAWAEQIRTRYLEQVSAQITTYERVGGDVLMTGLPTLLRNAVYHMRHIEATYWIDNRSSMKV